MTRGNPEILNHLDLEWLGHILTYAFEHCLGRMSYSPGVCMDFLEPCLPYIENKLLGFMFRRIKNYEFSYDTYDYKKEWNAFKDKIEAELISRGFKKEDYEHW